MKCTNCGLPLSPTNTNVNCPRCHTTLTSGPKAAVVGSSQQYDNREPGEMQKTSWGQEQPFSSSPMWQENAQSQSPQTPFPRPGQMWQPAPTPPSLPASYSTGGVSMEAAASYNSDSGSIDNRMVGASSDGYLAGFSVPVPVARSQRPRTSNVGFIVAALCVITGGLLLVFVHFMALGLPSINTANAYNGTPVTAKNTLPSPILSPSPTLVPSPTMGAFPGQAYIDNPQMATLVNTNNAQPIQTAMTFKVGSRIFVTFDIHPNGKNGAVCLFWYLNSRFVTQYPFSVTSSANAGYSYAVYGGAGQAYVDIYWASTTACTDKILAQHVSFTVTR